jgi:hypothetical protein
MKLRLTRPAQGVSTSERVGETVKTGSDADADAYA